MANYNKSYNFEGGIQVDTDNFVVNAAGLVGIGTTIPTDYLDVNGTSTFGNDISVSGLVTSTNLYVSGITTAGIITGATYYGDGSNLANVVGYTTEGWVVKQAEGSAVVRSGIATDLKVGIGTTQTYQKYDLIIGADPLSSEGISFEGRTGNVNLSGIITATLFHGSGASLTSIPNVGLDNSSVSYGGISVALGAADATPAFDLTDATNYPYTSLTGITTEILGDSSPQLGGNLDLNTNNITGTGAITISGTVTAADFVGGGINTTGVSTFKDLYVTGISTVEGVTTANDDIKLSRLNGGTSGLSTYWGAVRYGNENASFPYSTRKSVDVLNYDTGNVNFYIDAGNRGGTLGDFFWHKGSNNTRLMTLTNDGNLGIGITQPEYSLHVSGISTFIGAVYTLGNITVGNDLIVNGSLNSNVTGDLTGDVTGNVNSTAGLSTFYNIQSNSGVGIGTIVVNLPLALNANDEDRTYISSSGKVGIRTTHDFNSNFGLMVPTTNALFRGVGIGSTSMRSAADFSDAGAIPGDATSGADLRFMLPPQVTASQRTGLTTVAGALVYNLDTNKLNLYTGSGWEVVTSS